MIAFVNGTLEIIGDDQVAVRVGGIGVQVYVPGPVTETLGVVGQEVTLFTTMRIRDDVPVLYGFPTAEANRLFDLLLGVSGVGPRLALGLLSAMTPDETAVAIVSGNADVLSAVPGIGKRTAGRIVLDLQTRLQREWEAAGVADVSSRNDVSAALQALGYTASEIQRAVTALAASADLPLEEQLRMALQHLAEE